MISLLLPHLSSSLIDSLASLNLLCHSKTDARFMQDAPKAFWSIPYVSVAFFPSLKQNFIAYHSSKVSSRPDCFFEIHQLWQSGFSRVYSNSCCSCSFGPEIINIGQWSHKMYSNNIVNFQESATIVNACTKKSGDLLKAPRTSSKSYWKTLCSLAHFLFYLISSWKFWTLCNFWLYYLPEFTLHLVGKCHIILLRKRLQQIEFCLSEVIILEDEGLFTDYDKRHLKKARGCSDRNVVNATPKKRTSFMKITYFLLILFVLLRYFLLYYTRDATPESKEPPPHSIVYKLTHLFF